MLKAFLEIGTANSSPKRSYTSPTEAVSHQLRPKRGLWSIIKLNICSVTFCASGVSSCHEVMNSAAFSANRRFLAVPMVPLPSAGAKLSGMLKNLPRR